MAIGRAMLEEEEDAETHEEEEEEKEDEEEKEAMYVMDPASPDYSRTPSPWVDEWDGEGYRPSSPDYGEVQVNSILYYLAFFIFFYIFL